MQCADGIGPSMRLFILLFIAQLPTLTRGDIGLNEDGSQACSWSSNTEAERGDGLLQQWLKPFQILVNFEEAVKQELGQEPSEVSNVPTGQAAGGNSLCWTPPKLMRTGWTDEKADNTSMVYVPTDTACPAECPYSQPLDDDACFKACVPSEYCKALHPFRVFADDNAQMCTPSCGSRVEDVITGCMECESPGVCKRCSMLTVRTKDGRECKDYLKFVWRTIYVLGVLIITASIMYMIYLQARPIISPEKLSYATANREVCMPWRAVDRPYSQPDFEKFPLTTRSWDMEVSGIGTMLYFRWMNFLLCIGIFLFVGLGITYNVAFEEFTLNMHRFDVVDFRDYVDLGFNPSDCKSEIQRIPKDALDVVALLQSAAEDSNATSVSVVEQSAEVERPRIRSFKKMNFRVKPKVRPRTNLGENRDPWELPAGTMDGFRHRMVIALFIMYVITCVASLAFSRSQLAFSRDWDSSRPSHRQYAVLVKGLPSQATDAQELQKFFQDGLDKNVIPASAADPYKVIGVSIAYDYYSSAPAIENALRQISQTWSDAYDEQHDRNLGADGMAITEGGQHARQAAAPGTTMSQRMANAADRIAEATEKATKRNLKDPTMVSEEELEQILLGLKCHGHAYVVLSSLQAKDALLEIGERIGLNFKGERLTLEAAKADPHGVIWQHFSAHFNGYEKVIRNFGIIGMMMFCWIAIYVPYAVYNMMAVVVAGEIGHLQDSVLGALIAVGNALVTITIEIMVSQFGCLEKDRRESITMVLIFIAMTINTLFDICIVMMVLKGMSKSMSVYGTLDVMHYHRILAKELFMLIVPGYIITPYLICPIFEDWLPHWMERRRIRSTQEINRARAEVRYKYKEFDITWRFSDLLTNFTICIASVMFSTHHMYLIMVCLLAYLCLVYALDQYRLVRMTSKTFIVTDTLNEVFSYWWSVPTGFLGSISVHYWHEFDVMRDSMGEDLAKYSGYTGMLLFFIVHVALYCSILRLLVSCLPNPPKHTVVYQDMCEVRLCELDGGTYFNTNPVHVLKTWLNPEAFQEADRNCMPYVQGKEHLQTTGVDDAAGSRAAGLLRSRLQVIDSKTDLSRA